MIESQQAAAIPNWAPIRRLQWFTIAWMSLEVVVAMFAAVRSHSVALATFGGDSAIELFSAAAVLWRFNTTREQAEETASQITGWLLVALAIYVGIQSLYTLVAAETKPRPSYLGMVLLIAAAFVMPWLAHRKRQLAFTANSPSLRADAAQSSICGYMAWIALAGLLLNASGHFTWADPVAALAFIPIISKEAKEAFEGKSCCGH
jgi:divalent metal cation (Fe/Co/Zn/Cd) transporter